MDPQGTNPNLKVRCATPKASRGQKEARSIATNLLILVFLALAFKLVGVWLWALTSKMVWPLITQGNLYSGGWISICRKSLNVQKNFEFLPWINRLQLTAVYCHRRGCKGNVSCTSYSRTFTIHNYGYGKLHTSSRTTWTCLSTLRTMAWTPQCTLTRTLRSFEHAAHRL